VTRYDSIDNTPTAPMNRYLARTLYVPETPELRYLPECPRYLMNSGRDASANLLGWVAIQYAADVLSGSLNILDLDTLRNESIPLPGRPGFFTETTQPGLVLVGLDRKIILVDINSGTIRETGSAIRDDDRVIINDGLAVPGNGVIFGTKHLEFNLPIADLFHLDCTTGAIRTLRDGQMCSNGKFIYEGTDDNQYLIDTDSIPRTITRYRLSPDLGTVLEHSPVTLPGNLPSIPDGLRPDPDGESILVAFFNPELVSDGVAQLIRIADGEALAEWKIPGSPRVTCPEIILHQEKVCAIFSTASEGMTVAHHSLAPLAGAFFIAETPFTRLPEPPPLIDVKNL
jgi:sugar lactone lactonase YvrE